MITNCRCNCMKCCCTNNFNIQVKNEGFFYAKVSVNYFNNGEFIAVSSGKLGLGGVYTTNVPSTAYNVVFRVYNLSTTPTGVVCQNMYSTPMNLTVTLEGAVYDAKCTEKNNLLNCGH